MPCLMRADNLTKTYDNEPVLADVSFTIGECEVKGIMGPSGAGKSTLIRCLNGMTPIDSGQIYLNETCLADKKTDLNQIRSRIGFVFQDFNLFTHLTIRHNVTLGLRKVKRIGREQADEIAIRELDRVGLKDKLDAYPAELSGGQQQRAAIARALAMNPDIMLFDEPTSALDPESVGEVLRVMRELVQSGMTMIIVSHEMAFIQAVADDVLFMVDGRVYEEGSTRQIFEEPSQPRTREFIQGLAAAGEIAAEEK
ncbi:amino acid ABC transporter ATP-binding protein [Salinisphaera sp. USBA-960]|uniref:amino acid ABC transporter ATP-binding protein n=1 Tax=Salinisphaera orenii TaxID=856731 RepID=UPI000DBE14B9|nr:amino acid ABC transporter ATP-binding protein [Salifodinibacter halophilus]NNC25728.1 amino acid ABC transporter ATP-binding protein [Salifodinibacter halophilus]